MPPTSLAANLFAWILQSSAIALAGASLPLLLRIRHPRTQLIWCQSVLALCLALPFLQPWIHTTSPASARFVHWLPWIILAGSALASLRILFGLWRIRRCRIQASPLYPIPEAMRAASAITNADAMFCLSDRTAGPVMLGWLAPVVLLPESFLSLGEEAQCGIACHELLHVRRGDWLVTLLEEFAGALLWFNPGAWVLRSEARLAREQLVDSESVRLTEAHEPYIDALLAIARGRSWSDLAPAPLFLRQSHLTQRMQRLLSDRPDAGAPRVFFSWVTTASLLTLTTWLSISAWPMTLQIPAPAHPAFIAHAPLAAPKLGIALSAPRVSPVISTPAFYDPSEPVTGGIRTPSTPDDRTAAFALLARARRNALRHSPDEEPYSFRATFTATQPDGAPVSGELTEIWINGRKWRWTVSQGDFEHTRLLYNGQLFEDRHTTSVPMRAHSLRNQLLWATGAPGEKASVRTAETMWHGQSLTCILAVPGGAVDTPPQSGTRQWNEEEYCVDDASRIVVYSPAPGSYTQFTYDGAIDFHGRRMADKLISWVHGVQVTSAAFEISAATQADAESLTPAPGMTSAPAPVTLGGSFVMHWQSPDPQPDSSLRAIVHASIDSNGNVTEAEVSASSSPAFSSAILNQVQQAHFGYTGTLRQAWIEAVPGSPR